MIHSKNNAGFTLIEVLFAVAIIGMAMPAIYMLQGITAGNTARYARFLERFVAAKNFMLESRLETDDKRELTLEKKLKQPEAQLIYTLKGVSGDSPLNKFKAIRTEQVTIEWQEGKRKRTDNLVTFVFKPERKKE